MSGHDYLTQILAHHQIDESKIELLRSVRADIEKKLKSHYGSSIQTIRYSGSYSKGTSIDLHYDLDICIYFKHNAFYSLYDMFFDVGNLLKINYPQYSLRQQRVSWGLTYRSMDIDIVPIRSIDDQTYDGYLYCSDTGSYTKTNIVKHIEYISESNSRPIIKLMKIWRNEHNLKFTSFALELLTIQALSGYISTDYADRMWAVLSYINTHVTTVSLLDPSNTANDVSKSVSYTDKFAMSVAAYASLQKKTWEEIIW